MNKPHAARGAARTKDAQQFGLPAQGPTTATVPLGPLAKAITEAEFQRNVIALAHYTGWIVAHFRPGLNRRGQWQTAVDADGAGFPDLVLANWQQQRTVFMELKREGEVPSPAQINWLGTLRAAGQHAYVVWPHNWEDIKSLLEGRHATGRPGSHPGGTGTL